MVVTKVRKWQVAVVVVAALTIGLSFMHGQGSTTFNAFAVTNQGQFVNARLSDNVYVDMTVSPPVLRATRPILHVKPIRQIDESWLIPSNLPVRDIIVVLNGLEGTLDADYKIDPGNAHRLIPFNHEAPPSSPPAKWCTDTQGVCVPWDVKVHLFP